MCVPVSWDSLRTRHGHGRESDGPKSPSFFFLFFCDTPLRNAERYAILCAVLRSSRRVTVTSRPKNMMQGEVEMAFKSKVLCEACGHKFSTTAGDYDDLECPACGCVGEICEYEGQDVLDDDDVFDLVDEGVIPCV